MKKYFLDVPVYRLSEEKYDAGLKKHLDEILEPRKEFLEGHPEFKALHIEVTVKGYGGIWMFNEIVGYIRLYIYGTQVRGEYFTNDVKKHVKTRKKIFKHVTDKLVIEADLTMGKNNLEIYHAIFLYIEECKKVLKHRYVDDSIFKNIGAYVDWMAMIRN